MSKGTDQGTSSSESNLYDGLLIRLRLSSAQLAGTFSSLLAIVIAISICMQKDPPGFAYIALLVFGAVPIVLLLRDFLSGIGLNTPDGAYSLQIKSFENIVNRVVAALNETDHTNNERTSYIDEAKVRYGAGSPQPSTVVTGEQQPEGQKKNDYSEVDFDLNAPTGTHTVIRSYAPGTKVMILDIGEGDAFFLAKSSFIGRVATVGTRALESPDRRDFYSCALIFGIKKGPQSSVSFREVQLKAISDL